MTCTAGVRSTGVACAEKLSEARVCNQPGITGHDQIMFDMRFTGGGDNAMPYGSVNKKVEVQNKAKFLGRR